VHAAAATAIATIKIAIRTCGSGRIGWGVYATEGAPAVGYDAAS
jgi:hypothetical protein